MNARGDDSATAAVVHGREPGAVGAVLLGDRRLAAVRCHDLAVVQIRGEVSVDLLRCGLFGLVGR